MRPKAPMANPTGRQRQSAPGLLVLLVFALALIGLVFYQPAAAAVCPHPVRAAGRTVACNATPAAPSPSAPSRAR